MLPARRRRFPLPPRLRMDRPLRHLPAGTPRQKVSDFDLFTLDDIDAAFKNVVTLKYFQNYLLNDKGEGIVIIPHVAGHSLGGTVWKITKDGEDIVYAVDFNHRKERHLKATVLGSVVRPAVLITDAYNALNNQCYKKTQDEDFIDSLVNVLVSNGSVLLPVDTAGRVLELLLILDKVKSPTFILGGYSCYFNNVLPFCLDMLQYWSERDLVYPIYFLTNVSTSTIDYVKSLLEWMSDEIRKSFEENRENAFFLKKVTLIINKEELDKLGDAPKVVLASMASLEVGFSHDIFVDMANEAGNLVLFTEKGQLGTLAHMLQMDPPPRAVKVTMSNRIPLVGDELKAFEEEQVRIKKEEMLKARLVREGGMKDFHGLNAKAFDPVVIDASSSRKSSNAGSHLGGNMDILIHGFVPPPTSVAPRFLLFENTAEWDDFGEIINTDEMMKRGEIDNTLMLGSIEGLDAKIDEDLACLLHDSTPSKIISNEMTVHVKCSLIYMDFEGRSDARSIKSVIAHVAPRKLVLVHGSTEATEHLKIHCAENSKHVYAPKIEETIDVTSDISFYKVQLSENLTSHIMPRKIGELEIAWLDAEVEKEDENLILNPPSSTPPPRRPVLVGDLKLADLKQFLEYNGLQVEFADGALRCGEYITLRKIIVDSSQKGSAGSQQIVIEGPLCEDYYKIRKLLYSQFYML
ncbi:unnamed protein product [Urochloa decumbens]|uniref:Cleavage and polyadenylation specificity factor subunit 2 n=1 Tax=Urochloa decumbens TaxID=240449 RepID=A0ABC9B4Y3_9POAL